VRERNTHTTIDTALGPINQGVIDMSQLSTESGRQKKWVRSAAPQAQAPLTVPPLEAARLLGFCVSTTYKLMRAGELKSFTVGKARRVLTASIYEFIERQLTANDGGWQKYSRRERQQASRSPKRRARVNHELHAE
jgi:excisionase family DNA binding protein